MAEKLLYPLKFVPLEKEMRWGSELWLLSGLEGDETEVMEGFLSENTPNELTEIYMGEMVGDKVYARYGYEFPLLVKRIMAKELLSVQVHPTNELAEERHNAYGKCELWYVNEAEKGAILYLGLKNGITSDEYIKAVENGSVEEILNKIEVKAGDIFYIPAGTIHSIGGGITITEIQQSSDITYRIYDWDRVDSDGKPRELHTDLAFDAINFEQSPPFNLRGTVTTNELTTINANEYFITEIIDVNGEFNLEYSGNESFILLIALDGSGDIEYDIDGVVGLDKGDLVMIPADLEDIRIVGSVKVLKVEPSII